MYFNSNNDCTYTALLNYRTVGESKPTGTYFERTPTILRTPPKWKTLDLFAGCGGLSCGLHASGLTESTWAVEIDPKAAASYAKNFPGCKVYKEDVSVWFKKLKVFSLHWVAN